jgi:hypothetical protein
MGYYVTCEWSLRINTSWQELSDDLLPIVGHPVMDGMTLMEFVSEEVFQPPLEENDTTVVGASCGKYHDPGKVFGVMAKHASGTIDCIGEDNTFWRDRFADGAWTSHEGKLVYPTDD